ncbi:MAG: hypothetical protein ABJP45_07060 [Cyclobacteriaceae bacterium]
MTDVIVNVNETGPENFDFLVGEWSVHNRLLNSRLSNSTEWSEFSARLYGYTKFLGGNLNIENFEGERNGQHFHGSSIRVYNPEKREWVIYWVDSNNHEVLPQVIGIFKDGVGEFYGEDIINDEKLKLRFIWKDISEDHAVWEQAYFDENSKGWEINWIMTFDRTK